MGTGVTIIPPPGFPDPREPVSSFARAPGNIMTAPPLVGFNFHLDEATPFEAVSALGKIIAELDKGDSGKFSDAWCADADLRWSGGREMREAWRGIAPFAHLEGTNRLPWMRSERTYWGYLTRERMRSDAVRFLLYYLAGYEIRWTP